MHSVVQYKSFNRTDTSLPYVSCYIGIYTHIFFFIHYNSPKCIFSINTLMVISIYCYSNTCLHACTNTRYSGVGSFTSN